MENKLRTYTFLLVSAIDKISYKLYYLYNLEQSTNGNIVIYRTQAGWEAYWKSEEGYRDLTKSLLHEVIRHVSVVLVSVALIVIWTTLAMTLNHYTIMELLNARVQPIVVIAYMFLYALAAGFSVSAVTTYQEMRESKAIQLRLRKENAIKKEDRLNKKLAM